MSDKDWFVVITEVKHGINKYAVEYSLLPFDGFESEEAFEKWQSEFKEYFVKRTAIKERVLTVEPAPFLSTYPFKKNPDA